jgi:acyl-CoA synthetase (AMP-forming)/AMP-acid ligase II
MRTIPQVLIDTAAEYSDSLALKDGMWNLSYQELLDVVLVTASALKALGLGRGDRFAIWAPNCAEWMITALAGQGLGAVLVPLNTRYKGPEAADILRRSKCKLLFTVDGFLGHDYPAMLSGEGLPDLSEIVILKDGETGRHHFDALLAKGKGEVGIREFQAVKPDDMSDIIFTSGTTGAPKGAMTNHGQNVAVFTAFTDAIGLQASDRYLIVNPFFHSFGYKAGWLSCLIKGVAVFPLPVFDPIEIMGRIADEKITVMPGAPTIFQTLLGHPDRSSYDLSSLRVATTGATTIPVDLIRRMGDDLGIENVYSAYGLTESCGVVSLCEKGDDPETIATTCGKAMPETELRLVDDAGHDVADGDPGEIWVRGFNVMQGYLDDPVATAETITPDGWLKTGDIGTRDVRGYIKITDRKKDMVIVGGFNCYPAEIEKILLQHPAITDVAVTGVKDDRLGEVTCAWIVASQNLEKPDLKEWSRERMANFKVPRQIVFKDALPRNPSGKVQKFKLSISE